MDVRTSAQGEAAPPGGCIQTPKKERARPRGLLLGADWLMISSSSLLSRLAHGLAVDAEQAWLAASSASVTGSRAGMSAGCESVRGESIAMSLEARPTDHIHRPRHHFRRLMPITRTALYRCWSPAGDLRTSERCIRSVKPIEKRI